MLALSLLVPELLAQEGLPVLFLELVQGVAAEVEGVDVPELELELEMQLRLMLVEQEGLSGDVWLSIGCLR